NFYSIGEGLAGLTVTATNRGNGQVYSTTTASGGGYEIPLPAGHYSISIRGLSRNGTVGKANGKIDFRTDTPLGLQPGSQTGSVDAGDQSFVFGLAGDRVVVGDWNGDGHAKVGVFRSNAAGVGVFSLDTNGNHAFDAGDDVFTFGLATDQIVIGDWNGNGKAK